MPRSPKEANGKQKKTGEVGAHTIAALTSGVFDTKRRGIPKPGCDCVQCFGYCLVDRDEAVRASFALPVIAEEKS